MSLHTCGKVKSHHPSWDWGWSNKTQKQIRQSGAGISSSACKPWRLQSQQPSTLQHEIQGCRRDLVSWTKAKQGIAWLTITGSYTQTLRCFPLICPSPSCCCSFYLVVHTQYFHQCHPQTLPRDLSGCWSRKWIFYSSLAWSITYKLLLYLSLVGKKILVGSDRMVRWESSPLSQLQQNQKKWKKEIWMWLFLVDCSVCTCTVLALLPNKSHSWVDNYRQLILRWHRHTGLIGLAKCSLIQGQFEYFIFNYLMLSLFTDYQSACSIFKQFPMDNIVMLATNCLMMTRYSIAVNKQIVFTFTVVITLTCWNSCLTHIRGGQMLKYKKKKVWRG